MKREKNVRIVLFLILLLFSSSLLWSKGQKEEDLLVQVDQLLEQRLYNDAILLLTEVARKEPDRFDQVNDLLQKIRVAQEAYNTKYQELLDTYETDLAQAYVLIKELEDMNPSPNERTRESLIRARETAGFVFNRNRWEGIMEEALGLLREERFWEAVEVYRGGFDLSRDIFNDAGYDSIMVAAVDDELAGVNRSLDRFRELQASLTDARSRETAAFDGGTVEAYEPAFQTLLAECRILTDVLVTMRTATETFGRLETAIRTSRGDDKQVFHLVYLELLLSGRPDADIREGIIGTLDKLWTGTVASLTEHTDRLTSGRLQSGLEAYDAGNREQAVSDLLLSERFADLDGTAFSLWEERLDTPGGAILPDEQTAVRNLLLGRRANILLRTQTSEQFRLRAEAGNRLDSLTLRELALTTPEEGAVLRSEFIAERQTLDQARALWTGRKREYDARAEESWNLPEGAVLIDRVQKELEGNREDLITRETALVVHTGTLEEQALEVRVGQAEATFQTALSFLQGVPLTVGTGDAAQEIQAVYPDRALESFTSLNARLDPLLQDIQTVRSRLEGESAPFRQMPGVLDLISRENALTRRIQTLKTGTAQNIQTANQEIFTAQRFRQEGDRRLTEARQLLRQGEYPGAKERLSAAVTRYDDSLTHQEDAALRNVRDRDIPALFREIQDAENRLVIAQVRQYLTEGQGLYSQAEFASANALFLRAQNRWADTNTEANPEVEYWLDLTRTALSVTTGREISPTDPLYTEMQQYLNQATQEFNTGVGYSKSGNTAAAAQAYSRAERNLLYVQQFFPFNKNARELTLRISQQKDPAGFQELFRKDFTDARTLIRTNPQQAYLELKDLETIDPRYPGLAAAITEAEYATGIKVRPPDPQKVARSRELYQLANRIYTGNNRTEFQVALAYLNEALTLVPDYQEARRLKDTLAVAIGGTSSEVLSSADQQKYQEAVAEFTAGNYLRAQIIVDILLNNPDNRNNTRLLELKARIDSAR